MLGADCPPSYENWRLQVRGKACTQREQTHLYRDTHCLPTTRSPPISSNSPALPASQLSNSSHPCRRRSAFHGIGFRKSVGRTGALRVPTRRCASLFGRPNPVRSALCKMPRDRNSTSAPSLVALWRWYASPCEREDVGRVVWMRMLQIEHVPMAMHS